MIKFLKFSFTIINTIYIKQIDIQPNKYDIYLNDNKIKGSYNMFKLGDLISKSSKIEISNETHPNDYTKMTKWIENLDSDYNPHFK
jgi:hypothetical protein